METSKKILYLSWGVALVLTVLLVLFPIGELSIDGLAIATPLTWVEVASATGFYYWKAKNENRSKYAMRYLDKITKKYDQETAIRIAEIVLKD